MSSWPRSNLIRFEVDSWANLVAAEASFVLGRLATPMPTPGPVCAWAPAGWTWSRRPSRSGCWTTPIPLPDAHSFVRWLSQGAAGAIPANAGQAARFRKRIIFHLSDVHFGSFLKEGKKIDAHRFRDGENTGRLSLELQRRVRQGHAAVGVRAANATIVLSGESTYTASEAEFDLVRDFLNELCGSLGLEPQGRCGGAAGQPRHRLVPVGLQLGATDTDNYLAFAVKFYGKPLFRELYPLVTWDLKMPGSAAGPQRADLLPGRRHHRLRGPQLVRLRGQPESLRLHRSGSSTT